MDKLNNTKCKRIIVGYAPKNHVKLALDEIEGLEGLGYVCGHVTYGRNNQSVSGLNKLIGVIINAFKIVKALYKFQPDIIYLNSRFESVASTRDFISILIFKVFYIKKLRVIIKSHGSDLGFLCDQRFFFKKIVIPFLIKNVHGWFFLSQEEKDEIKKYSTSFSNKVSITSNIIDPSRSVSSESFKKRYGLDDDKFKFLYVGRIVNEKGVFSILKSIPQLEFKENCLFYFVGDGPHMEQLRSLANELKLDKYVRFTGFIEDSECDHFYANADALVFPTFYTEGFPMTLFKSAAAGLPIITTSIRAAKDHLKSPDNVLWVDGRSEQSVAHAIRELYYNPALRREMANNNKIVGKKFSKEQVSMQMAEVFSAL